MSSNTFFKYNPKKTFTPEEEKVRKAGFPFVSTVTLKAPGDKRKKSARISDRLDKHAHHSNNTHLIVSGGLQFQKMHLHQQCYTDKDGKPWIHVPHSVIYSAIAGPEGCVFVEGHTVLSPKTADRFRLHGTMVYAKEGEEGAFEAVDTIHTGKMRKVKKIVSASDSTATEPITAEPIAAEPTAAEPVNAEPAAAEVPTTTTEPAAIAAAHNATTEPITNDVAPPQTSTPDDDAASNSSNSAADSDPASTPASSVNNSPVMEAAEVNRARADKATVNKDVPTLELSG